MYRGRVIHLLLRMTVRSSCSFAKDGWWMAYCVNCGDVLGGVLKYGVGVKELTTMSLQVTSIFVSQQTSDHHGKVTFNLLTFKSERERIYIISLRVKIFCSNTDDDLNTRNSIKVGSQRLPIRMRTIRRSRREKIH